MNRLSEAGTGSDLGAAAGEAELIRQLLDFSQAPGRYAVRLGEPHALFRQLSTVAQWALGRLPQGVERVAKVEKETIATAAVLFIQRACFAPDNTHYQVLGFTPQTFSPEHLRRRYRALIRLTHPDMSIAGLPANAAGMVNRALDVLSDPAARQRYDDELRRPPTLPSAAPSGAAPSTTTPSSPEARKAAASATSSAAAASWSHSSAPWNTEPMTVEQLSRADSLLSLKGWRERWLGLIAQYPRQWHWTWISALTVVPVILILMWAAKDTPASGALVASRTTAATSTSTTIPNTATPASANTLYTAEQPTAPAPVSPASPATQPPALPPERKTETKTAAATRNKPAQWAPDPSLAAAVPAAASVSPSAPVPAPAAAAPKFTSTRPAQAAATALPPETGGLPAPLQAPAARESSPPPQSPRPADHAPSPPEKHLASRTTDDFAEQRTVAPSTQKRTPDHSIVATAVPPPTPKVDPAPTPVPVAAATAQPAPPASLAAAPTWAVDAPAARSYVDDIVSTLSSAPRTRQLHAYLAGMKVKGTLLTPASEFLARHPDNVQVQRSAWAEEHRPNTLNIRSLVMLHPPTGDPPRTYRLVAEFQGTEKGTMLMRLDLRGE